MQIVAHIAVSRDGSIVVEAQRGTTVLNPEIRDIANEADLTAERIEQICDEMKEEITGQLGAWKQAVMKTMGA